MNKFKIKFTVKNIFKLLIPLFVISTASIGRADFYSDSSSNQVSIKSNGLTDIVTTNGLDKIFSDREIERSLVFVNKKIDPSYANLKTLTDIMGNPYYRKVLQIAYQNYPDMTNSEAISIMQFTQSAYYYINSPLRRSEKLEKDIQVFGAVLFSAVKKCRVFPTTRTLYRAESFNEKLSEELQKIPLDKRKGKKFVIRYNRFLSTSKLSDMNTAALTHLNRNGKTKIEIEHNLENAYDISRISAHPEEGEVLFVPGQRFEIKSYQETTDKYGVKNGLLELKQIDPNTPFDFEARAISFRVRLLPA